MRVLVSALFDKKVQCRMSILVHDLATFRGGLPSLQGSLLSVAASGRTGCA